MRGGACDVNVNKKGRVRQFSHVEGNYATSVNIRVALTRREKRMVDDVVRELQLFFSSSSSSQKTTMMDASSSTKRVRVRELLMSSSSDEGKAQNNNNNDFDDGMMMMMHVSLSRTFPIRKEQREPYRARLKTRLGEQIERRPPNVVVPSDNETNNNTNAMRRLELKRMKVFVNDARTTTFVALCENNGEDATLKNTGSGRVRDMIRVVNEVNEQFGFPKYEYEPCVIPHASFCYADGDWEEEMRKAVEAVVQKRAKEKQDAIEVTCKTDAIDLCISGWEPKKVFSSERLPPPPI
jgi:hypothetical protein